MEDTIFRSWVRTVKEWLNCSMEVSSTHEDIRLEALHKARSTLDDLIRDLEQNEVLDEWREGLAVKLSELKPGAYIVADGGFECMSAGTKIVEEDEKGLFVACSDGKHYLDGQLSTSDGDTLVGFTRVYIKEEV